MMNDHRDPKSPLDREAAMKLCSGDEELFRDLTVIFLEDAADRTDKLEQALDCGDMKEVRRLAHAVKGLCANICALPLKDVASRMEKAAEKEDTGEVSRLRREFDNEFARLRDTLAAH